MITEADTCRKYVQPKLREAGWDDEPHSYTEQKTFTDGRIVPSGGSVRRRAAKRADYLLRYTRDFMIAVVEAKPAFKSPGDGLQQAKEYAEILGLSFAYSTNGEGIVEFDYLTGQERELEAFPTLHQLWERLQANHRLSEEAAHRLLTPYYRLIAHEPRYYLVSVVSKRLEYQSHHSLNSAASSLTSTTCKRKWTH